MQHPPKALAARKRTLNAVKLAHANAPFERAADRCDFACFDSAALCARQQQNVAKLKADAQKVVGIIKGDKAKNETFCQMVIVGKAIDEAIQEKDNKKAAELAQKLSDLEENLGPEYVALVEAFRNIDPNSKEAREIVSTFDTLDESCSH